VLLSARKSRKTDSRAVPGPALILIDVVNGFDFPGSEGIVRAATRAAPRIEKLAERARERDVPVIYVNDNFGRWRSDFKATLTGCTEAGQPGRAVAQRLRPHEGDFFVLKPQHSGFYSTPLNLLLEHIGAHTLILTGFATNLCVVFTAHDAHMRGYRIVVPEDCTASNSAALTLATLRHVQSTLAGDTRPSSRVDFARLARPPKTTRRKSF
jgi:nicotinamidase-related amidase